MAVNCRPGLATKASPVSVADAMRLLGPEYGPVEWSPRYDAASELVYTILSQHTSDVNSNRSFESLMQTFGTLDAVAEAPVERIEKAVRMGGLAKIKAPRIKEVLKRVTEEVGSLDLSFLSEVPLGDAKAWLRRLPGVGPKTAAIILCFALGMPALPVDTHVYRVARRLGLIGSKVSADRAHDVLEAMVPSEDVFAFHVYLILHGRGVCKAQRPRCGQCVLAWGCPSRGLFEQAPSPSEKGNKGRRRAKRRAKG